MTKKRAKRGFIILSIVLAIGLFLTFCPFYISLNYSTFNGFFNSIALGTDLAGGQYSVYECSLNEFNGATDFDKEMDITIANLQNTLNGMGYRSAIVSKENTNRIRVETAKYRDLQEVQERIGSYASIYITAQNSEDFDVKNPSGRYISTHNVSNITNNFAGAASTFNIMIYFDGEGAELYNEITKEASAEEGSGNVYIYVIDNEGNAVEISNGQTYIELKCEKESSDNFIGFSSNGFTNQNSADVYMLPFICATYGVTLDLVETEDISPIMGNAALTCITIAVFVAFAIAILILAYRYGDFGWLAGFSSIFFLVMNLFLLQAIPFVVVSMGSLLAIVITYLLLFDGFVIIFEKIRDEYRLGIKLPLAVKGGFKKAVWPIVDTSLVVSIIGLALCFFGVPMFKSIGFILLVGALLSAFTTLVLAKLVCGWYLYLNSTNAKRVRLVKDKTLVIKNELVIDDPQAEKGE